MEIRSLPRRQRRRWLSTTYVGCSGSSLVSSRGRVATSCLRFPLMRECERRFFIVGGYFRTQWLLSTPNAPQAGVKWSGQASGGLGDISGAELGGQPFGGGLHQLGAAL